MSFCEACERDDHANCGMQTWCDCDCDPEFSAAISHPEPAGGMQVPQMLFSTLNDPSRFDAQNGGIITCLTEQDAKKAEQLFNEIQRQRDEAREQLAAALAAVRDADIWPPTVDNRIDLRESFYKWHSRHALIIALAAQKEKGQ